MNVGATSETDYGDYFMWGSTTPNTNTTCDWKHAPFNNGLDSYNEEYFTTHKSKWLDDNGNLKPEFDAARAIMGGDWRMPTKAEFQELLENTDKKWTQVNGVNGYNFTGSNGNSIFIPAAGLRSNSSFHYQGSFDLVWSSSLNPSSPDRAWMLYSTSDLVHMNNRNHNLGFVVRGVFK